MDDNQKSYASSTQTTVANNAGGSSRPDFALSDDIMRGESAVAAYGGDDPHGPPYKEDPPHPPSPILSEKADPNKVHWDGPDDPTNPQNWSTSYKWLLTSVVSLLTINVTFASSAPTSGITLIAADLHVSREISYLVTTVFLIGYVFGPIMWAPSSELLGRRPIFLSTMIVYCLFHLGQALAPNMQTLLVTRFLSGLFASAPITNSGGVIADIWDPIGRGYAMSVFTACVFVGPVLGPIVGGFLAESFLGWRWIFWIMMIFSGTCWIVAVFLLPETFAPVILQKKARQLRKADPAANKDIYSEHDQQDWSFTAILHRTLLRPFNMLLLEPILVLLTAYLSLVYGLLYALFEAFPIIFIEKRGLTLGENGLIFAAVGIGSTTGAVLNIYFISHYPQLMRTWRGHPPPEQRLFGAMFAGPCLVVGIMWLGWTGQYPSIPWYVPALSAIVVGMCISLVFISFLTYLTDTYLMYSASALAANTILRSAVAAGFPLFTVQMFTKLGVDWASTLLGCIALLLAPSPFFFYKYGARIRGSSKFAPCIDLKIAKELEDEKRDTTAPIAEP